jgi:hypothetical protein
MALKKTRGLRRLGAGPELLHVVAFLCFYRRPARYMTSPLDNALL